MNNTLKVYDVGMEEIHPLDKPGVRSAISAALGVSPQVISNWKARGEVPIEHCAPSEKATNGLVTRQELRPDDWQDIWPELAKPKTAAKKEKAV